MFKIVDKEGRYGTQPVSNLTIGILRSIMMELKMATPIIKPIIIDLKMPMVRLLTGCVPYLPSLSTIPTIF